MNPHISFDSRHWYRHDSKVRLMMFVGCSYGLSDIVDWSGHPCFPVQSLTKSERKTSIEDPQNPKVFITLVILRTSIVIVAVEYGGVGFHTVRALSDVELLGLCLAFWSYTTRHENLVDEQGRRGIRSEGSQTWRRGCHNHIYTLLLHRFSHGLSSPSSRHIF